MYSATGRTSAERPNVAPAAINRSQLRPRTARRSSKVPPTERVLALLDFTGDGDDATQSLLFGSTGIYFHVERGIFAKGITHSVPYADFGRRRFINHGKEVYLGDAVPLTPPEDFDAVSCETICNMLNALKQANVQGQPG